jgi:hypothetical protein
VQSDRRRKRFIFYKGDRPISPIGDALITNFTALMITVIAFTWGQLPTRRPPPCERCRTADQQAAIEGLPTASSQTVPMNGCFLPRLLLLVNRPALRTDTTHVHTVDRRSWTNPEEVDSSSTALADERRLHESALVRRSIDRYRDPDLRARNRARDRGWHRIPWTGCLLVPKAARSQDRSQSQIGSRFTTRFLGVLATITRVRPRGQRVDDRGGEPRRLLLGIDVVEMLEVVLSDAATTPVGPRFTRSGDRRVTGRPDGPACSPAGALSCSLLATPNHPTDQGSRCNRSGCDDCDLRDRTSMLGRLLGGPLRPFRCPTARFAWSSTSWTSARPSSAFAIRSLRVSVTGQPS